MIGPRRWLGQPPPDERLCHWSESEGIRKEEGAKTQVFYIVSLALAKAARSPAHAKDIAEEALKRVEQLAADIASKPKVEVDAILIVTIPLVRIARGDGAAAKRWKETTRASYIRRRQMALDAGLALEAVNDHDGALEAYRLGQDPLGIDGNAFETLASMVKEAELLHTMKRDGDAKDVEAKITALTAHAEPGVVEALRKLR